MTQAIPVHFTRRVVVHGMRGGIPWAVHVAAWKEYISRLPFTRSTPDTIARGGGFSVEELDDLLPDWRERTAEIDAQTKKRQLDNNDE